MGGWGGAQDTRSQNRMQQVPMDTMKRNILILVFDVENVLLCL